MALCGSDMTDSREEAIEKAAEKCKDEILALNPNGFTVASYVNSDTLSDCFEQGARWAFSLSDARCKALREALEESKACWDAAYSEGFPEAMNEARARDVGKNNRLLDLLDRRLLYALAPIINALEADDALQAQGGKT